MGSRGWQIWFIWMYLTTSFYVFYLGVFAWKMEEWQANNAENDELEALNREYEEIRQQEE